MATPAVNSAAQVRAPGRPATEKVLNTAPFLPKFSEWFIGKDEEHLDTQSLLSFSHICKKINQVWKKGVLPHLPIWQRDVVPLRRLTQEQRANRTKVILNEDDISVRMFGLDWRMQNPADAAHALAQDYPCGRYWWFNCQDPGKEHGKSLLSWERVFQTLACSPQVSALALERCSVAQAGRENEDIGNFPDLFTLIRSCKQLTAFAYLRGALKDASLERLVGCDSLTQLNLIEATGYTADGLVHLKALPKLSDVSLAVDGAGGLTHMHLKPLGALQALRKVSLGSVESWLGLTNFFHDAVGLEEVVLSASGLKPLVFRDISRCANLRILKLSDCAQGFFDGGIAHFRQGSRLETLDVAGKLSEQTLGQLHTRFPNLTALKLDEVDDEMAKEIATCSQLREFVLRSHNVGFCHWSMGRIAEGCRKLEDLTIMHAGWLGIDGALEIAKLPKLQRLNLHAFPSHPFNVHPARATMAMSLLNRDLAITIDYPGQPNKERISIQHDPSNLDHFLQLHLVRIKGLVEVAATKNFQEEMDILKRVSPVYHMLLEKRLESFYEFGSIISVKEEMLQQIDRFQEELSQQAMLKENLAACERMIRSIEIGAPTAVRTAPTFAKELENLRKKQQQLTFDLEQVNRQIKGMPLKPEHKSDDRKDRT